MNSYDSALEQRVWERVSSPRSENRPECLTPMMAAAAENAAVYRQLSLHAGGQEREQLRRLSDGEGSTFRVLQGMAVLGGSENAAVGAYGGGRLSRRRALAECCRRGLENYRQFASWTAEPEYGAVFQEMAARQASRLCETLELIGIRQQVSGAR